MRCSCLIQERSWDSTYLHLRYITQLQKRAVELEYNYDSRRESFPTLKQLAALSVTLPPSFSNMKAILLDKIGGEYKLVEDVEKSNPAKGQVLVKSLVTAVNPVYVFPSQRQVNLRASGKLTICN